MPEELVLTAPATLAWRDVPARSLTAHEVRVQCHHAAEKHGTMAAFFKGYANERGRWDADWRLHRPGEGMLWSYPIPLGNMAVGEITAVGDAVTTLAVGDRVVCYSPFRTETVVADHRCWKLPASVPWQSAVCLDPALFALAAIRDGHVRMGDAVAVFGLGAIGLCAVQIARAAGATVFAIDPVAERRAIALTTGASAAIDAAEDVGLRLKELTDRRGVDVVIDFSGSVPALQAALRGVGYLGTIVLGAFPPPHTRGLDFGGEAHMNRPTLVFSRGCSDPNPDHPRWDEHRLEATVLALITNGQLDGQPLVGPIVHRDQLAATYRLIADQPGQGIKLSVAYPHV